MLKVWNALKATPGYGSLYRRLTSLEDKYPTALYMTVVCMLASPFLVAAGLGG